MKPLPVHGRAHLARDNSLSISRFVRCPEDGQRAALQTCRRCARCESASEAEVHCTATRARGSTDDPSLTPITDVMDSSVVCVDGGATVETVLDVMDQYDVPIAVVLDENKHAVGVCSRRELRHAEASQRVAWEMTPFVITMLEGSTVADALQLMVERGLHHIPILSHGQIVGTVTPRAAIQWLMQKLRDAQQTPNDGAPSSGTSP